MSTSGKGDHIPRANEDIPHEKIRLVGTQGEMLGVFSLADAITRARASGVDVVEVAPQAEPPVCKLLDYGKFRFEASKKKKQAKKKQKVTHIKEIKMRVNIGEHDYQVKLKSTRKFLENKDKVKVSLRFRGREITHQDLAEDLFARMVADVEDLGKMEQESKVEGRQLIMVLAPL